MRRGRSGWRTGAALAVLVAALGGGGPAHAGQSVVLELKDGRKVEGELLGFGGREYRVRVGDKTLVIREADIVEMRFVTEADRVTLDRFPLKKTEVPVPEGATLKRAPRVYARADDPSKWRELLSTLLKAPYLTDGIELDAIERIYDVGFGRRRVDELLSGEASILSGVQVRIAALELRDEKATERYLSDIKEGYLVLQNAAVPLPDDPSQAVQIRFGPTKLEPAARVVVVRKGAILGLVVAKTYDAGRADETRTLRSAVAWVCARLGVRAPSGEGPLPGRADWAAAENGTALRRAQRVAKALLETAGLSEPRDLMTRLAVSLGDDIVCFTAVGEAPAVANADVLDRLLDVYEAGPSALRRSPAETAALAAPEAWRKKLAVTLGLIGRTDDLKRVGSRLLLWLEDGTDAERALAHALLAKHGDRTLVPYLRQLVFDPAMPGEMVAGLLVRLAKADLHDDAVRLLADPRLRERAFVLLLRFGRRADHARVLGYAKAFYLEGRRRDKANGVSLPGFGRLLLLNALAKRIWDPAMNEASLPMLREKSFRSTVARLIQQTGDARLIPALEKLVDDKVAGKHAKRLIKHFREAAKAPKEEKAPAQAGPPKEATR